MADFRMADSVLDAALDHILNNADRQVALSADPVNYAGVAGVTLAATTMIPGDFTKAAGTVSGRKVSWGRKGPITPSANGTATHMAFVDDTATEILLMWPVEAVALATTTDTDFAEGEYDLLDPEGA